MPDNLPADIYKILTQDEMDLYIQKGCFEGSPLDRDSGFIHCATQESYPRILAKFFQGIRPVYLVTLDAQKLNPQHLRFEANHEGGTLYPHYYAALPFSAVKEGVLLKD